MAVDPLNPLMPNPPTPYGTSSVAQRVEDIAGKDSGLNQMARTEAAKVMNRRGMLNSSMAVGAAQDAVLRAAVPIASQDASQAFQGSESALDRTLQEGMQQKALTAAEQAQIKDIKFREGQGAADRLQAQLLQSRAITADNYQQAQDIKFQTNMQKLNRDLQAKLASWNLKSSDRNAAAQFLTNMETMFASSYQAINANTNLNATQRTAQLTAAKKLRDRQLNFVEQLYNIDLKF